MEAGQSSEAGPGGHPRSRLAKLIRGARSDFVVNFSTLAWFTCLGQAVTLIAAPVISRVYAPSDFGLFGLFLGFAMAAAVVVSLGYEAAIPSARDEDEAAALVGGSFAIALLMAPILAAIYAAAIHFDWFGFGDLPLWSIAAMLGLLWAHSAVMPLQYWFVRRQIFRPMAHGILGLNTGRALVETALGAISSSWLGLAAGEIAGRLVNVAMLARPLLPEARRIFRTARSRGAVAAALREHRRLPFLLPAMLIDMLVLTIVVAAINLFFGAAAAGQYFLMRRVLDIPVGFAAKTFADAFHGKAAELGRTDMAALRRLILRLALAIALAAGILFSPLIFFGRQLFGIVFGDEWREAGLLAGLMVPALVASLAVSPVARVFMITRRPALRYIYSLSYLFAVGSVLLAAHAYGWTLSTTIAGISAATVLAYGIYLWTAYHAAGHVPAAEPDLEMPMREGTELPD